MLKPNIALLVIGALFCGSADAPPRRIALVIGNGVYAYAEPLPNALRDARAVTERLQKLGFVVKPNTLDLDQVYLRQAVTEFGNQLRTAGPNVVAFVYYSGHAAQDALGVNYMLPTDADPATAAAVRSKGMPVSPLLQAMEDANNNVNVVVLDACRDWFKQDRDNRDPKGLHDMGLHGSVLIAYATRAGATADDGPGLQSSPFSRRLIEALQRETGDPIALIFDDVQSNVYSDTDSSQMPMYVNGLVRAGRWALSSGNLAQVRDTPRPPVTVAAISPFLQSLDRAKLLAFTRGNTSFVDVLLKRRDLLQKYEVDTPNRLAYFLASIAFETGGFRQQTEKFGYSATSLRATFPSRIKSDEQAAQLAGTPEAIANVVYANRLGNGPPESGDGWRYRGRSLFFITGRGLYRKYGEEIGADLVDSSDLANDLETGLAIAGAVWKDLHVNVAADKSDLAGAARRFRGSSNSGDLPARNIWLIQAKRAVSVDA